MLEEGPLGVLGLCHDSASVTGVHDNFSSLLVVYQGPRNPIDRRS